MVKKVICAVVTGLFASLCFGQGFAITVYRGAHSSGAYDVTIRGIGAFSERSTSWYMDVSRDENTLLSDYVFRPFYAWTCVMRGTSEWVSESILHFKNLSAQGRCIEIRVENKTGESIPYAEVWGRSVDRQGYPHSPSIFLFFDMKGDEVPTIRPEIFPGAEYFVISCEFQGEAATSRFRVPAKKGWPHDIDLDDPRKRITLALTPAGPTIDGGAFEALTPQEAKALVPDGVRLHLTEKRREPFKHLGGKIE